MWAAPPFWVSQRPPKIRRLSQGRSRIILPWFPGWTVEGGHSQGCAVGEMQTPKHFSTCQRGVPTQRWDVVQRPKQRFLCFWRIKLYILRVILNRCVMQNWAKKIESKTNSLDCFLHWNFFFSRVVQLWNVFSWVKPFAFPATPEATLLVEESKGMPWLWFFITSQKRPGVAFFSLKIRS